MNARPLHHAPDERERRPTTSSDELRVAPTSAVLIRLPLLVAFAASACIAVVPPPDITPSLLANAESLGFTEPEVAAGRRVFTRSCGRCHAIPNPSVEPSDGWESVLRRMGDKSKSSPEDRAAVRAYVLACASTRP